MCQNTPRLLFIVAVLCVFSVIFEPTILSIPQALAAAEGAAASAPNSSPTRQLSAPMLRLMSEIPILRQLVTPPPSNPVIGVGSTSFSFTTQQGGGNPAAQTLSIRNTGGGTLNWTASGDVTWLTLSPASGTGNGTVTISPIMGSLPVGTHRGIITISATGASSASIQVTVTVTAAPAPPAIGVSTTSVSFTAQQGGGNPAAQTLSIRNTGGGTLNWTASGDVAWLTLSPASGTGNGTVTISPIMGSLPVGTHRGIITISATGAPSISIQVPFTVTAPQTSLTLSPSSLAYTGVSGGAKPANQSVTVSSNGNWTASSDEAWLTLSPTSGSGNGTITAGVNLGNIPAGTNTATITVTDGGTMRTVKVTLTLSASSLTLSSNSLTFKATQGAANPPSQIITISSNGTWTASDEASWLSLSPASGSNTGTITASVNTANVTQENNSTTITVTSGSVTKIVTVTLTLSAPSSSSATLTWNANQEKDLAGYKVYRATKSGAYGSPIATLPGNITSYQATGLQFSTTYYFVVTAYDRAGNESGYSNEVSKSIY